MAYCSKCGTQVGEGVQFCPSCGNPMTSNGQAAVNAQPADDVTVNKGMAILAYFGPLVFVPMFAAKNSKFARFHANQGLTLFILDVAYAIVQAILSAIFLAISWQLWSVMTTILGLAWIVIGILAVIGVINAAKGNEKELPVIGKVKILK